MLLMKWGTKLPAAIHGSPLNARSGGSSANTGQPQTAANRLAQITVS